MGFLEELEKVAGPIGAGIGLMVGGAAGAAAGYNIGSGISGAGAAKDAAKAETEANREAIAFQREKLEQARRAAEPFRFAGQQAINPLLSMLGISPIALPTQPMFSFQSQQQVDLRNRALSIEAQLRELKNQRRALRPGDYDQNAQRANDPDRQINFGGARIDLGEYLNPGVPGVPADSIAQPTGTPPQQISSPSDQQIAEEYMKQYRLDAYREYNKGNPAVTVDLILKDMEQRGITAADLGFSGSSAAGTQPAGPIQAQATAEEAEKNQSSAVTRRLGGMRVQQVEPIAPVKTLPETVQAAKAPAPNALELEKQRIAEEQALQQQKLSEAVRKSTRRLGGFRRR